MVAYSFKGRFVEPIKARTKRQTIRKPGKKRHARPGDALQIYTGDRFHPKKVGEATCETARPICLGFRQTTAGGIRRPFVLFGDPSDAKPADILLTPEELDNFAKADGFDSWDDLEVFWLDTHGAAREFEGVIITWGDTFVAS